MEEVWDRLRQATSNDAPLVDFLQRLLTLDPEPRAHFAALANHPYVQAQPALPAAVTAAVVDAALAPKAGAMPSKSVLAKAVMSIPGLEKDRADDLDTVPGIPYLVCDADLPPVCETASGIVYR